MANSEQIIEKLEEFIVEFTRANDRQERKPSPTLEPLDQLLELKFRKFVSDNILDIELPPFATTEKVRLSPIFTTFRDAANSIRIYINELKER